MCILLWIRWPILGRYIRWLRLRIRLESVLVVRPGKIGMVLPSWVVSHGIGIVRLSLVISYSLYFFHGHIIHIYSRALVWLMVCTTLHKGFELA